MFDKRFLQRALLAFTAGLFLACAARIAASPEASVGAVTGVGAP